VTNGAKKPSAQPNASERAGVLVAPAVGGRESTPSCHKFRRLSCRFGRERGKKSATVTRLQQRGGLRSQSRIFLFAILARRMPFR
jgi:hypothetical protein